MPGTADSLPPLWRRWKLLLNEDWKTAYVCSFLFSVAICEAILAGPEFLPHAAILAGLPFGILTVFDFRDLMERQVKQQAARVHPAPSVSLIQLLSSPPELNKKYHRWMDSIPVVKWHPRLLLVVQLAVCLKFSTKHDNGCGWLHALACHVPGGLIMAARVALQMGGTSKRMQSFSSILATAYILIVASLFMASGDPCVLSVGPGSESLSGNARHAAFVTIIHFIVTPCTNQHLDLLCCLLGLGNVTISTSKYLHQNSLSLISAPGLGALQIIGGTTSTSLVLGACFRSWITKTHMIDFLRSNRSQIY